MVWVWWLGWGTYGSRCVAFSRPVHVLHEGVEDATDAEGGLDDIGDVFAHRHHFALLVEADQVLRELHLTARHRRDVHDDLALRLHGDGQLLAHIL